MISPRLIVFSFLVSTIPVFAEQDAPVQNVDSILRELTSIETKLKQSKASEKSAILSQIQAASASGQAALNFYLHAVEEIQFRGRPDKVTAFIAWKKTNTDLLRSKDLEASLLFHLRYLSLALQRKGLEKPETLLPATMAYVTDLSKGYPADDSQQVLSKPLGSSVFAQLLQLNEWLPDDATWEMTPNNVTGILDKNVRPILRDAKNPQLLQTWDLQMKLEADAATNAHNAHKVEVFNSFTRQKLVYQRALDMIALGLPNRATGEIFTLIKTYPQHPDCPIWMAKIRELINRSASAAPGTSPQPTPETSPQ